MQIRVYVQLGLVGCKRETTIEVEDDSSPEDIEEQARDAMLELIEWGWAREENKHPRKARR